MSTRFRVIARIAAPLRTTIRYFATPSATRAKTASTAPPHQFPEMKSLDTASSQPGTHIQDTATSQATDNPLVLRDASLGDVLQSKKKFGTHIHAVGVNDKISVAMEMMNQYSIGAVLVRKDGGTHTGDNIVGIVSTRDYVRVMQEEKLHPTDAPVNKFMTNSPVFAYADDSALTSLDVMQQNRFRHLPVKDRQSGRIVGLVTIGDLVRMALLQLRESNHVLKDYLSGHY